VAWSHERERWYYQDPVSGVSSWFKPKGCPKDLELPTEPPKNHSKPRPPTGEAAHLPPDWEALWDDASQKHFYYNTQTKERTWFKPVVNKAELEEYATRSFRDKARQKKKKDASAKDKAPRKNPIELATFWDADTFVLRLQEARASRDKRILSQVLTEVKENNEELYQRLPLQLKDGEQESEHQAYKDEKVRQDLNDGQGPRETMQRAPMVGVPETCYVSAQDCANALRDSLVEELGEPLVSFSSSSVTDALLHFANSDRRRVVCGLNYAHGVKNKIGGGYPKGSEEQEADLCRRLPALYPSLMKAADDNMYNFGPSTCLQKSEPNKYSDVLYTPNLWLARGPQEEGYGVLPEAERVTVSVVSAAPPDVKTKTPPEQSDMKLMYETIRSIFVTPVYKEPLCTTLIVGPWGCGHFGNKPETIVDLFAKAIDEELGKLYHEIHFALPVGTSAEDHSNAEVFRAALTRLGAVHLTLKNVWERGTPAGGVGPDADPV